MKRHQKYALAVLAVVLLSLCGRYFLSHLFHTPPLAAEAAMRSQPSAIPDSEPTQYTILVTVMGKVENPGVVLMPMGSTVMDAILRAGGPLADGDLSDLDLERKLYEDQGIFVP